MLNQLFSDFCSRAGSNETSIVPHPVCVPTMGAAKVT